MAFCHGGIVPEYLFRNYILRGLNDSVVLFGELSGLELRDLEELTCRYPRRKSVRDYFEIAEFLLIKFTGKIVFFKNSRFVQHNSFNITETNVPKNKYNNRHEKQHDNIIPISFNKK